MIQNRPAHRPPGLCRGYALPACLVVAGCDGGLSPAITDARASGTDARAEAAAPTDADAAGDASGDAAEVGDVRDVGDAEPLSTLGGDWVVSTWTLTRAVGSQHPMFPDGGTDSDRCAQIVRESYRAMTLRIDAVDGTVSVNGATCRATLARDSAQIGCPCGSSFQVCSHDLALRRDVSSTRLVGDEGFVFSYSSPPYCRVAGTLEATRSPMP